MGLNHTQQTMGNGKGKAIFGSLISFASGVIGKKNPLVGLIIGAIKKKPVGQQVKEFITKNNDSVAGGEGKTDFAGIVGSVIGGVIILTFLGVGVYLLITGRITLDQFIEMQENAKS